MKTIKWDEDLQVPFNDNGLCSFPGGHTHWRKNEVISTTLNVLHFSRGRSSAKLELEDVNTGQRYSMFLTDVSDLLKYADITNGKITGDFAFTKLGQNYGIKRVGEFSGT